MMRPQYDIGIEDDGDDDDDDDDGNPVLLQHRYHALLAGDDNDDNNNNDNSSISPRRNASPPSAAITTTVAGAPSSSSSPSSVMDGHNNTNNNNNNNDLWDQLNDEQSREVRRHQSRFHAHPPTSRTRPWTIAWSMATQAASSIGMAVQDTATLAHRTWREQQQRQQHQQRRLRQNGRNGNHPHHNHLSFLDPMMTMDDYDMQFGSPNAGGAEQETLLALNNDDVENQAGGGGGTGGGGGRSGRPLRGYPFVVLRGTDRPPSSGSSNSPMGRPRQQPPPSDREHDPWGIVGNLDVFLTHLYQYYYHRGLIPMTCKFAVEMASLLFTLWLSRILLGRVDWWKLGTCKDETSCSHHWSDYYRPTAGTNSTGDDDPSNPLPWTMYLLLQGYTGLILVYATFATWTFWQSLQHATTCQTILHDKLGLSRRKLQGGALAWDVVVRKLVEHGQQAQHGIGNGNVGDGGGGNGAAGAATAPYYRTETVLGSLDPLSVAQRIMRKENFLIAMWNCGLLDGCRVGSRRHWSGSLEWVMYMCVLNFMFNHRYEVRPAFVLDAPALERRLKNVYDLKATREYMGNRQWSSVATWTFREFNELPHMLEQRLEPSHEAATRYVGLFGTSEWMAALGRVLVFLGGAVGGVLLVLGVMNDAILLHVQLWGRNLLWYAGMAGIVYSIGKALLPTKEATPSVSRNLFDDMDATLKAVSQYTHYYPEYWKGRGWDANVYASFKNLYDTKVKLFLYELTALILAPYILYFRLSQAAPAICEFCLTVKARVPGAGDVCGFSTFDFDAFGDEAWEGRTLGKSVLLQQQQQQQQQEQEQQQESDQGSSPRMVESLAESIMRTGNLEEATNLHPKPKAREGKMEKSFFTFQAAHPNWKCSPSGQSLVDRVEEYRMEAMTRERGLHIEAAARQLETLARLEQQTNPRPNQQRFGATLLRDSHYGTAGGRTASIDTSAATAFPTADAGAGSHSLRPLQEGQPSLPRQDHVLPRPGASMVPQNRLSQPPYHPPPPLSPLHSSTPSQAQAATVPVTSRLGTPNTDSPSSLPTTPNRTNSSLSQRPSMDATAPVHEDAATTHSAYDTNRDLALSTELSRLFLSGSGFLDDAAIPSPMGTANPTSVMAMPGRNTERQYYWLERFHEHLERQQEQAMHQQASDIHTRSASAAVAGSRYDRDGDDAEWGTDGARSLPPSTAGDRSTYTDESQRPVRGTSEDATSASSVV